MKYGLIAAGEKHTAEAARHILEAGGNAFDAAVASVFTSMTSEYALTSAGGGGACLAWKSGENPVLYDFFVDAPETPENKDVEFFSTVVDFGTTQQIFHIGKGSIAVPGNIKGLYQIHSELGSLPISTVLEPAMLTAKNGVPLAKLQSYAFDLLKPILSHDESNKNLFYQPDGAFITDGCIFNNPDFANFLDILIDEGPDYFYSGDGADIILSQHKSGGFLDEQSLLQYQVIKRKPVQSSFAGKTIYSNPMPSKGGVLIKFLLTLLDKSQSNISPEIIALGMNLTSQVRKEFENGFSTGLLSQKILDTFSFKLDQRDWDTTALETGGRGETTHVSILDKEGNAVSITTTNGEGSGYVVPGMGIMLNNMLGEEDLNPDGFHKWNSQCRIPSMIAPTIVAGDGGPELILGSGGSNRIRSAISQVIINYCLNNLNLESAVRNPRIHLEGGSLHCEPGIDLNEPNSTIPSTIEITRWDEQNMFFGGVNAVTKNEAVGDARRGGVGIIC